MSDYARDPKLPVRLWMRQIAIDRLTMAHRRHVGADKRTIRREFALPEHSSMSIAEQLVAGIVSPSMHVAREEVVRKVRDAVARLEGGYRSIACASGLAAIGASLMAFLDAGDHLLMVDSAYSPTRKYCEIVLKGFGVETTYYDPLAGAEIKHLFRPETKAVFAESPGSLTFEVLDVPAIAAAAHDCGAVMILDNSWATPLYFQPFAHGVDISIQAATKYLVGHSDVMMAA